MRSDLVRAALSSWLRAELSELCPLPRLAKVPHDPCPPPRVIASDRPTVYCATDGVLDPTGFDVGRCW